MQLRGQNIGQLVQVKRSSEIKFLDFVAVRGSTIVVSERWPDSDPDLDYVLHVIDIEAGTIGTLHVPTIQGRGLLQVPQ